MKFGISSLTFDDTPKTELLFIIGANNMAGRQNCEVGEIRDIVCKQMFTQTGSKKTTTFILSEIFL